MTRPRVTLKLATSLDGRIATASGESRWITGEASRQKAHELRAAHDAVLVGIGTVLADDPELTVRLEGYSGVQPVRVVLDSRQRTPAGSRLVRTVHEAPVWLVTLDPPRSDLLEAGVNVIQTAASHGRPDAAEVLGRLARDGLASVLIEGGGEVAASFLRAGLVDALEWFRAPMLLGAEGRPAIGGLGLDALADAPRFQRTSVERLGDDLHERYLSPMIQA